MVLQHHIFTAGEWRRAHFTKHPTVRLRVNVNRTAFSDRRPNPRAVFADVDTITDSGVQSDVWSLDQFLASGFSREDLHPVSLSLQAAHKSKIKIDDAFFAALEGRDPRGNAMSCRAMIYVSSNVKSLFMSYNSLLGLGILPLDFPIGGANQQSDDAEIRPSLAAVRATNDGCGASTDSGETCDCQKREAPPRQPASLHRMVATRKHDGTPRRTVDLSSLDHHGKREAFATESPIHFARHIPRHIPLRQRFGIVLVAYYGIYGWIRHSTERR